MTIKVLIKHIVSPVIALSVINHDVPVRGISLNDQITHSEIIRVAANVVVLPIRRAMPHPVAGASYAVDSAFTPEINKIMVAEPRALAVAILILHCSLVVKPCPDFVHSS